MTVSAVAVSWIAVVIVKVRRWPQRVLERPTLMLFAFNAAAQLVSVCAAPLLTRLYSPEQFGVLGAITAIVMVCVPLSTGRYELALPRARTDAQAFDILRVCFVAIGIGCSVAALSSWLVAQHGPGRLAGLLSGRWYFVPLGIVCVALYDTLAMEASRQSKLRALAFSKLSQVFAGVGGQLAFGWLGWSSMGLLVGFVLNHAVGVSRLCRALLASHAARGRHGWQQLAATALEHRRYPLFASWTSALEGCAKGSVQFAFALLWDPKIGGFIFLTDRLVGRPLQLLSSSLLPVYVANVSRALKEAPGDALRSFDTSLRRQAVLAVAWTIGVVALAPWIIGPLFGAAWTAAVPYVQTMTLAIAPLASLHAVAYTLQITGHQRLDAALVAGKVAIIAAVVLGGYWAGLSALTTLEIFALAQLGLAVTVFCCYRRVLKKSATAARPPADGA